MLAVISTQELLQLFDARAARELRAQGEDHDGRPARADRQVHGAPHDAPQNAYKGSLK